MFDTSSHTLPNVGWTDFSPFDCFPSANLATCLVVQSTLDLLRSLNQSSLAPSVQQDFDVTTVGWQVCGLRALPVLGESCEDLAKAYSTTCETLRALNPGRFLDSGGAFSPLARTAASTQICIGGPFPSLHVDMLQCSFPSLCATLLPRCNTQRCTRLFQPTEG